MVISSTLHMNENNFHNKNFALRLALKRRQTWTRKWPIPNDVEQHSSFYRLHNGARWKRQASLSENGSNEEWMPARHKGVQKTEGQWATVALPQQRAWGDINAHYWIPSILLPRQSCAVYHPPIHRVKSVWRLTYASICEARSSNQNRAAL